jgi:hypothetical protein
MHKRSLLWAGAGVLLLTGPGDGAEEARDPSTGDQPFAVPLASAPADTAPGNPPPSRPSGTESRAVRPLDDTP